MLSCFLSACTRPRVEQLDCWGTLRRHLLPTVTAQLRTDVDKVTTQGALIADNECELKQPFTSAMHFKNTAQLM